MVLSVMSGYTMLNTTTFNLGYVLINPCCKQTYHPTDVLVAIKAGQQIMTFVVAHVQKCLLGCLIGFW